MYVRLTLIRAFVAIAGVCGLFAAPAGAASDDPDWPCIQRKVPHISAGMVWAGPPIDEMDKAWRGDEAIGALVAKAAARTTDLEAAKGAIETYASGLAADKERRLTLLFTGLLVTLNRERDSIIAGIGRFARRQQALAKKIEQATGELSALAPGGSEAERARREELRQQIQWDTRIFDEREHSLRYVCEQPVLLEQRAFALAREVMNHLE